MDSGANALIIHKSYVSKNNFFIWKNYAKEWFTMAVSFSTSREAKITFKTPELNVTAHVSAPFHVTSKTMQTRCKF